MHIHNALAQRLGGPSSLGCRWALTYFLTPTASSTINLSIIIQWSFFFILLLSICNANGHLLIIWCSVDKSKILSLVLHCCDVAHPSKPWLLHRHWTDLLLEEFFQQGDNEKELGLPYSPLCDRNNTLVAESQIGTCWLGLLSNCFHWFNLDCICGRAGFIEFIVEPTMAVMGDLLDKILIPLRPQSAPVRNDHRDSISEEKCDAGWIHLFVSDQTNG